MEHTLGMDQNSASPWVDQGRGSIVLLQGPISGFFGTLGRYIESSLGIPVVKIQFNLADTLRDRVRVTIPYKGTVDDLERWYRELFRLVEPKAVVCFGDERPIHAAARAVCRANKIPFYAFDEGYIRPNYVTLEESGTNANSPYRTNALPEPGSDLENVLSFGRNILPSSGHGFIYNALMALGRPLFPRYVHHRDRPFWRDAVNWTLFFFYNRLFQRRDIRRSEAFVAKNAKSYYVAALQVYDDLQLRRHGRGWTPEKLIDRSVASFAKFAPSGTMLVIKQHPLDTGHRNYARLIEDAAARYGVADRVVQMRYANQLDLLKQALGLVTINSTLGISALSFGCRVLTLGDCIYARDGLAVDGEGAAAIDAFWTDNRRVDEALFNRFRHALISNTQINGDFYIRRAWSSMLAPVCAKILGRGRLRKDVPQAEEGGGAKSAIALQPRDFKNAMV